MGIILYTDPSLQATHSKNGFMPTTAVLDGYSTVLALQEEIVRAQTSEREIKTALDGYSADGYGAAGTISVVLDDGSQHVVTTLLLGAGSTVTGTIATIVGGSGGGSSVPGTTYSVLITSPINGSQHDIGDIAVGVRVLPAPPAGSFVVLTVDQVDVANIAISGETGTYNVSNLGLGSHSFSARFVIAGGPFYSATSIILIANQAPVITITSPSNESDATLGALLVSLSVTHPTASYSDFTVQVSFDSTFTTFVSAVWQSGNGWQAVLDINAQANFYIYARAFDSTPGGLPANATPIRVCSLPPYIEFTTEGQTFAPMIQVASGAVVLWEFSDSTTSSSLTPSKDFGSVATRIQRLTVTPSSSLRTLNFGYFHLDDADPRTTLGPSFDIPNQNVSHMSNPGRAALGLEIFCGAHNPFIDGLDFTGFSHLHHIELFQSPITSINLTGCTAIDRLCLEQCNITYVDITPCAVTLGDLRIAAQQGGILTIKMDVMQREWHWCVRGNNLTVITPPGLTVYDCLPVVEELWDFDGHGLASQGTFAPISQVIRSIESYNSSFTSLQLSGLFPLGRNAYVLFYQNPVAAINLSGCPGLIRLNLNNCNISTSLVDYVIGMMNSFGTSNGQLYLLGNSGPSSAGESNALTLISRGWTVSREDVAGAGTNVDEFTRADGTVGNGWSSLLGGASGTISNNALVRTDNAGYCVYGNPGNALPANYRVETELPDAVLTLGFFGLVGRWLSGNGVRLLFTNRTTPTLGHASGYNTNNATIVVTNGLPSSWATGGNHTLALEMNGDVCSIICDNQVYGYGIISVNVIANTYYGNCGEGGSTHIYNRMAAVAV